MAKPNIRKLISDMLEDFLPDRGLALYNSEFKKEGPDWYLRVYIEKSTEDQDAYVSTDDCEVVSQFLSERLDEIDPIEQNYYLEVSSPGLDRQLFEPEDYQRFAGSKVDVRLYKPVSGSKEYRGVLRGITDGDIVITDEQGEELRFPYDQVSKTNLTVEF